MLRLFYLFLLSLLFPLLLHRFQTAKAASCFLSVSLFFSPPSLARACGRNFFQSGRFYVSLFNEDIKRITTWIILGRPAGVVLPRGGRASKRGNSVLASEIPPSPPTLLSPVPLFLLVLYFFFFRRLSPTIILIPSDYIGPRDLHAREFISHNYNI